MTFHITSRGVRREPLFRDRFDFLRLLELLDRATHECNWTCLAYCLMTNHFHLVLRLREANLSSGMHLVNQRYARGFNDRYELKGHVFEARFTSTLIERDAHFLEVLRYVPLNPVRAGLCDDPADWEWSSFRSTAYLARPPTFLATREARAWFPAPTARERAARYAQHVRSGRSARI
jgi:REP-associated tyrosine transposase